MTLQSFAVVWAVAVIAAIAARADDADAPSANPYQPTVTIPASLTAPGWVEVELGGQSFRQPDESSLSILPYSLKLSLTDNWAIRATGNAWIVGNGANGMHLSGMGDTSLLVKRRFAVDDQSAFAVELGPTFATSRRGLGQTATASDLRLIYSADIGTLHTDANVILNEYASKDVPPGASRIQATYAWAWSHSFNDQWGGVIEPSAVRQSGLPTATQLLAAATYNYSKSVVVDLGATKGLNPQSPKWSAVLGVTFLAGRLF